MLVEKRQIKNIFQKKVKSLSVLNDLSFGGCIKSSKFERIMIVQTHPHDGKNERIYPIFPSKAVISVKNPPSPPLPSDDGI